MTTSRDASSLQSQREDLVERLRKELRRCVQESPTTQRQVELANGFTRGYLSQVLQGNVNLSARHLFGILLALDISPQSFFRRFLAQPERATALSEIRERMAVYDAAFKELQEKGVLSSRLETDEDPQ